LVWNDSLAATEKSAGTMYNTLLAAFVLLYDEN
jgi:hypothetical protein